MVFPSTLSKKPTFILETHMKLLRSIALLFAFVLAPLTMSSCGGGGSGSTTLLIRPATLDDLIISIGTGGPRFKFIPYAAQPLADVESGGVEFVGNAGNGDEEGGATSTITTINATGGAGAEESWPAELRSGTYTFTITGPNTGIIKINAFVPAETIGAPDEEFEVTITVLFSTDAGTAFIDRLDMVLHVTEDGGSGASVDTDIVPTISSITTGDGSPVVINYGGNDPDPGLQPNEPSSLITQSLDSLFLDFTTDVAGGTPTPDRFFFECSGQPANTGGAVGGTEGDTVPLEEGVSAYADTTFADGSDEYTYQWSTTLGTDTAFFSASRITEEPAAGFVYDDVTATFTLSFLSSSSGTWSDSNGNSGTFEIDGLATGQF